MLSGNVLADDYLKALGGQGGGAFDAHCPAQEILVGLELRTGDDVDAIRPLCAPAYSADRVGPISELEWHGGTGGGRYTRIVCPPDHPAVSGFEVYAEGEDTVILNSIGFNCDSALAGSSKYIQRRVFFGANTIEPGSADFFFFVLHGDDPSSVRGGLRCPDGEVATGVHGRSGIWVDAIGLICGAPRFYIASIGRAPDPPPKKPPVPPPVSTQATQSGTLSVLHPPRVLHQNDVPPLELPTPPPRPPICDRARDARARNSPVAANLEAQCLAAGGTP